MHQILRHTLFFCVIFIKLTIDFTSLKTHFVWFDVFQVSLHLSYNNEFLCGGVILNADLIVTVAHCMYYNWGGILPPIIVTVNAGRENLDDSAIGHFKVEDIRFHNSYKESTSEYDIALIKVSENRIFQFCHILCNL